MTLQSFFCLEFSIVPAKHDFLYLSLHLLDWNESKLPMFTKIYTIKRIFLFFLEKIFEKVSKLPRLPALRFSTKKWSYLFIYISYANKNYIPKFSITWSIFTKILKKISYKMESQYLYQLLKFSKKTGDVYLGVKKQALKTLFFLLNIILIIKMVSFLFLWIFLRHLYDTKKYVCLRFWMNFYNFFELQF